jgi:hypothetical protein
VLLVRRKCSSHFTVRTTETSDLYGTTADKVLWVEHRIDFGPDGLEEFGFLNTLDEIVLAYKTIKSVTFLGTVELVYEDVLRTGDLIRITEAC